MEQIMLLTAKKTELAIKGKLFRGFGDSSRLSILDVLRNGPLTVSEIVEATDLSQSNASNHLGCLRDCGLVVAVQNGRYVTYKEIAQRIGKPKAVRAVGRANATNPMPIIVPCHRILGSDGKLHGFSAPGGLETKAWLLKHEGSWLL